VDGCLLDIVSHSDMFLMELKTVVEKLQNAGLICCFTLFIKCPTNSVHACLKKAEA
jgi:hypothetical protein